MTMTDDRPKAPIELRTAGVDGVDFAQRMITVIAVPYEQAAPVEYRGEVWQELFERGSFTGIEKRPNRVRANRDHNRTRTVGKVVRFFPDREQGLVTEVRIGQTPLGDETLALADEDMLSASIGFGVLPSNQTLDKRSMTRRIKTAYLDHLSFVESPAYEGAQVLSVRGGLELPVPTEPLVTPNLDQFAADDLMRWALERLSK
jgi:HK97 family phage prohead protease